MANAISMANIKLKPFLAIANFLPNSCLSKLKVTNPTIVKVVKNATAGTILAPISTIEPTNGKATKAGIKVILPIIAEIIVAKKVFELPKYSLIASGGINVRSKPIKNKIPIICPNILPIIFLDLFIEFNVLSLSFIMDTINHNMVTTHNPLVKISIYSSPLNFNSSIIIVCDDIIKSNYSYFLEVFMNINNYKNLISHTYLFNEFSPEDILTLFTRDYYKIKRYEKNSIVYLQNELCNTIDIVLDGNVSIQKIGENGDILTIVTYSSGDIMGGSLAFSKTNQYPLTVVSDSRSTILHINRELILNLCQSNRKFLTKFLESLSSKALILTDKIKFISMKNIRDKIIEFLTYEYYLQGNTVIKLRISKKELAEKFGIQRPSLFRELKKMKQDGLIDYDSSSIEILDITMLKKV